MAIKENIYFQPLSALEKSIHFQILDLTKFLMCSVDINMGIISGTTHIKMIFNSLPATGKEFTVNALCSSNLENVEAKEWVPFFLFNDEKTSCPERHKYDGRSEVVHHVTKKLFPNGHDKAVFSIIAGKVPPVTMGSSKIKD
jgi:hypothetical protein